MTGENEQTALLQEAVKLLREVWQVGSAEGRLDDLWNLAGRVDALIDPSCQPVLLDAVEKAVVPLALLEALVDDEDCSFDHHGGCQAHGYLSLEPGEMCPQHDLKRRIEAPRTASGPELGDG